VGTVATNIADINNLASVSTEIGALGTSTNITNMSNLNATGVIANINTTAGISSDISTVAGISGGVTSLVASLEKTYVVTVANVGQFQIVTYGIVNAALTSLTFNNAGPNFIKLDAVTGSTGFTVGNGINIYSVSSGNGKISITGAEL